MEQMMLFNQMDPCRIKQDPETKGDCWTHVCKPFSNLLRIPWRDRKCEKTVIGGSYYTAHVQLNLNNNCNDEGRESVLHSLQAAEDVDSNNDEEMTKKLDQFYQELGAEMLQRRGK